MSDSPILNPGVRANEIASPDNLHTEPPFVRPVYAEESVDEKKVKPKTVNKPQPQDKIPSKNKK